MNLLVGILAYPGSQTSAVLGLRDLFAVACRFQPPGSGGPALEVRVLETDGAPPALERPLDVLILPPSLGQEPEAAPDGALCLWLRQAHREGTLLCSVCAGAFLLARTGLLDGRPATTHWAVRERFKARFPAVLVDTDRLLIDDGDLVTAGGLMAWVDLGLLLVGRFLGPATVLATARHLLVDPGGREQRFYSTFTPVLNHGDADILRAQQWLHRHSGEPVDVAGMARAARLGERTFLRRFQRAAGLRPTEYLQHLRVGRARDWLERSDLPVDEIAWRVGYKDPGAFRRTFLRLMGLSPGDYRRRFTHSGRA
jgi:transcriptional regulator GlxA family with amidase domain